MPSYWTCAAINRRRKEWLCMCRNLLRTRRTGRATSVSPNRIAREDDASRPPPPPSPPSGPQFKLPFSCPRNGPADRYHRMRTWRTATIPVQRWRTTGIKTSRLASIQWKWPPSDHPPDCTPARTIWTTCTAGSQWYTTTWPHRSRRWCSKRWRRLACKCNQP